MAIDEKVLNEILQDLLVQPSMDWISKYHKYEPFAKEYINSIQNILSQNKVTLKKARFLESYCRRKDISLKMYLAVGWSVIFFDGNKMSLDMFSSTFEFGKKKKKKKIKKQSIVGDFFYTIDSLLRRHKIPNTEIIESKNLLKKLIEKNKIGSFSFYGVPKAEWSANRAAFKSLERIDLGDIKGE